jgi:CxxC-x17-CxxC domain-containing protein
LAASASSKLAHSGSAQRSVTNHMEYVDRLLICADCNEGFVFSAGEQLFFSDKQFRNDPRRCKACRINRIDKKGAAKQGPSSRRTETRAICSQCEVETIVPFRPTNRRPVLCRQCFQSVQSSTVSPVGELALQS